MALPSRYGVEKKMNSMAGLSAYENGGPGSGNFGHSGRPGEIGGSSKTGSYEQLSGPARTRGEYTQKDASEDCKTEFSDVYGALSDHAYWIADEGGFADGYEARDYEALGDKYAGICDRSQSRGYVTQHDLVKMLKRTREEAEPYGLIDGSDSTDKMNDFLGKYDMDDKLNSVSDIFENGGKGSGNFGHSGRPGRVGGSGDGEGFMEDPRMSKSFAKQLEKVQKTEKLVKSIKKGDHITIRTADGSSAKTADGLTYPSRSTIEMTITKKTDRGFEYLTKDGKKQFIRFYDIDRIENGAMAEKELYDKLKKRIDVLEIMLNGGPGSGNFGHAGRPGEVGGSSKGGGVDLDHAKEVVKKMGEELRKKSPVRKQDEWFVTLKQIDDEYEKRGKEMEDNAGEVESAIYETGETWTGPKQKALDLVKIGIRTNRDMFTDRDEFLEQTEGLFDDLKDVEGFKAKTVDVYEHPMSASGIVIQEHRKK